MTKDGYKDGPKSVTSIGNGCDDRAIGQLAAGLQPDEASPVGRFSPRTRVQEGEAVEVVVDQQALHFFDPETGLAIRAA